VKKLIISINFQEGIELDGLSILIKMLFSTNETIIKTLLFTHTTYAPGSESPGKITILKE